MANDAAEPSGSRRQPFFVFERTGLGLMDQEGYVRGKILEFVHERDDAEHVPVMSLYDALKGSVISKASVTQEFTTTAEFYDRKTLCRADIEAMFSRATGGQRFHESWVTIQRDLSDAGMNIRQIITLQNSSIRYIKARSAGESGAVDFNTTARHAILSTRRRWMHARP